jgi:transposase
MNSTTQQPMEPPSTPQHSKASDLSRDERVQILTLRQIGWTYAQIVKHTGCTRHQIEYTCQSSHPTPRRRSGRPPLLTEAQVEELIEFVCASKANRRMAYRQIPKALGWSYTDYAIRYALRKAGFSRCIAWRKPKLSEVNIQKRLATCIERREWSLERWGSILWSDETWVTGGRHTRTFVTRRAHEGLEETCILETEQRRSGWMFWGSYSVAYGKGPCLF